MSVIASGTTDTPLSPYDLRTLEYLLDAEWGDAIELETAWSTAVSSAGTASEQRMAMLDRPIRTLSGTLHILGSAEVSRFLAWVQQRTDCRSLVPLMCDETVLTADPPNSSTLPCDTRYRRLCVGARVAVVRWTGGFASFFCVSRISVVSPGSLTLADALTLTFAAGDSVIPLLECDLEMSADGDVLTNDKLASHLTARETVGDSTLEPAALPGSVPAGFAVSTPNGLPLLPAMRIDPDWTKMKFGARRDGTASQQGRSSAFQTYGDRAKRTMTHAYLGMSREEAWSLLSFFDCMAGRMQACWLISPLLELPLLTKAGRGAFPAVPDGLQECDTPDDAEGYGQPWGTDGLLNFSVVRDGIASDYARIKYIWVRTTIGEEWVLPVAMVQDDYPAAGQITLSIANPFAEQRTFADWRVAYKARLDSDALKQSWVTSSVCHVEMSFVELVDESPGDGPGTDCPFDCGNAPSPLIAKVRGYTGSVGFFPLYSAFNGDYTLGREEVSPGSAPKTCGWSTSGTGGHLGGNGPPANTIPAGLSCFDSEETGPRWRFNIQPDYFGTWLSIATLMPGSPEGAVFELINAPAGQHPTVTISRA